MDKQTDKRILDDKELEKISGGAGGLVPENDTDHLPVEYLDPNYSNPENRPPLPPIVMTH